LFGCRQTESIVGDGKVRLAGIAANGCLNIPHRRVLSKGEDPQPELPEVVICRPTGAAV
jgi:hypothetical protein